ncbi:MAG: 16S rRNA (cytidine(1402)-2'-O)-methyltransferase [Patescibacteria group bacterium]
MLSIVSTPIGNLGDITLRALDILKTCDAIICEDTRVTGQLLKLLDLPKKELISCHGYSDTGKVAMIIHRLQDGQHLVLVSDAGTPGISDPGFAIVSKARESNVPIQVIPGASAFLAALSASGLPINQFVYLGFLPLKKGRQTLLKSFMDEERTMVFYESVHRIEKTLRELADALKEQPQRPVVIARELTKMHETVVATTVADLPAIAASIVKKGEFVVVVGALHQSKTSKVGALHAMPLHDASR